MDYITLSECTSVYILSIIYAMFSLVHGVHLDGLPWWNRDETVTKKWRKIWIRTQIDYTHKFASFKAISQSELKLWTDCQ